MSPLQPGTSLSHGQWGFQQQECKEKKESVFSIWHLNKNSWVHKDPESQALKTKKKSKIPNRRERECLQKVAVIKVWSVHCLVERDKGQESPQQWERDRGSLLALMLGEAGLERMGSGRLPSTAFVKKGSRSYIWGRPRLQRQIVYKTQGPLHSHGEKPWWKRLDFAWVTLSHINFKKNKGIW